MEIKYSMSKFATKEELEEAVMRDPDLSDIEKLHYIFNAKKDEIRKLDIQLYYAILGVLDSAKRPLPMEKYALHDIGGNK